MSSVEGPAYDHAAYVPTGEFSSFDVPSDTGAPTILIAQDVCVPLHDAPSLTSYQGAYSELPFNTTDDEPESLIAVPVGGHTYILASEDGPGDFDASTDDDAKYYQLARPDPTTQEVNG